MATKFVGFFLVRIYIPALPIPKFAKLLFRQTLGAPPDSCRKRIPSHQQDSRARNGNGVDEKKYICRLRKKNLSRFLRERRGGRKNKEEGGIKGKIGGERSWQRATNKQFLPNSPSPLLSPPLLSSKGILPIPHLGPVAPSLGGEYPDTQRNTQQQRSLQLCAVFLEITQLAKSIC